MNWSSYQKAIFDFNINGTGNLFVNAVAGSGKSTVIKAAIGDLDDSTGVLVVAFNKHISVPLEEHFELSPNVDVATLHAFGFATLRETFGFMKFKEYKVANILKYEILKTEPYLYKKYGYGIRRLISLFKTDPFLQIDATSLQYFMDNFGIDIDLPMDQLQDIVQRTWDENFRRTRTVDYDDMIAMPVYLDATIPKYQRVFVDESQDLSPVQIDLAQRAMCGRATFVGDPQQAIYQFRGADEEAVQKIIDVNKCKELPLSVSYRCAKAIVELAKRHVPHIEAYHENPEGHVDEALPVNDFQNQVRDGDYVLGRTTAPLVKWCLQFIQDGKKAVVRGRDIGTGLKELLSSVATEPNNLTRQLLDYKDKMSVKFERKKGLQQLEDQLDTLLAIAHNNDTVALASKCIKKVFGTNTEGIMCATIHRTKGLETDNVYIIRPDLLPHPRAKTASELEAEDNLWYVGVTRAKKSVCFVEGEEK